MDGGSSRGSWGVCRESEQSMMVRGEDHRCATFRRPPRRKGQGTRWGWGRSRVRPCPGGPADCLVKGVKPPAQRTGTREPWPGAAECCSPRALMVSPQPVPALSTRIGGLCPRRQLTMSSQMKAPGSRWDEGPAHGHPAGEGHSRGQARPRALLAHAHAGYPLGIPVTPPWRATPEPESANSTLEKLGASLPSLV